MELNKVGFTANKVRALPKWELSQKIYGDKSVMLGDKRPSYSTVKNWNSGFKIGHLSTEDEEHSGRPTQVTVPGNMDAIHPMILNNLVNYKYSRDPGDIPRNIRLYYC
jgi:hypothetical protein